MLPASSRLDAGWWLLVENIKHDWGKPHQEPYYDDKTREVRRCKLCDAADYGYGAQYHSCDIATDWPSSDGPCRCSIRSYLVAHGVLEPDESHPKDVKPSRVAPQLPWEKDGWQDFINKMEGR